MKEYRVWVRFSETDSPLEVCEMVLAENGQEALQKAQVCAQTRYPDNVVISAELVGN